MDFALNVRGARFLRAVVGAFAAAVAFSGHAVAQNYPHKPIKMIIGFAPGAGGIIGADFVAKAAPDGYTLMAGTLGTHAFNPNLYKALPYDALNDFTPITRIISGGFNTFLVNPNLPANNVSEFIALAKARAKEGKPLTFGSGGVGSVAHLAVELFKQAAGIEMAHIPYKGSSQVVADVIGGHVDLIVAGPSVALPLVEGGKLKAIAVDTPERQKRMPNVQTMSEAGIKNVELVVWVGVFAPAKTPPDVANKLHAALIKSLALDDVKAGFARDGMDIITDESPDAFRKVLANDIEKWGKVIKAANIPQQ